MKAQKIAALILSVSMLISCSEKQPYIPKEHIGIPAEYENLLFEKGKRNDIQINMEGWDGFVQDTMTADHAFGDLNHVFKEKEYDRCDVIINGEEIRNTGIRTKGIMSLQRAIESNSNRFSLVLKFNQYTDQQKYHGLRMIDQNDRPEQQY